MEEDFAQARRTSEILIEEADLVVVKFVTKAWVKHLSVSSCEDLLQLYPW